MDEYKTALTESLIVWVSSDSPGERRVYIQANAFSCHLLEGGGRGGETFASQANKRGRFNQHRPL